MQALFDDAQRMAPAHSRWMRQLAQDPKVAAKTMWLGASVKATYKTTDIYSIVFVPVLRIDDYEMGWDDKKEQHRLTVKSGVFVLDVNVDERYRLVTGKMNGQRLSNGSVDSSILVVPEPDIGPTCVVNDCATCPLWLPCRNSDKLLMGSAYAIDLHTFHFTKRGRIPRTKTWRAPGEEITGLGMPYFPKPFPITSGVVHQFIPQFIKDEP